MDIDDAKERTLDGAQIPFFEPEASVPPYPSPSVPVAAMVPPIIDLSVLPDEREEQCDSPYMQNLKDLEAFAKAEMCKWDASYLGIGSETVPSTSGPGTKRKGKRQKTVTRCDWYIAASELDSDIDSDAGHSDSYDEEDKEDRIEPYDPDNQDRPKLPIYHPGFKLTAKMAQDVVSTIIQYITMAIRSGYSDEEVIHLRNAMVKSKEISNQEVVRLAVAGDTGAGKSALLNAILGVLNLNIEVLVYLHLVPSWS
jgi:hypothetical protein